VPGHEEWIAARSLPEESWSGRQQVATSDASPSAQCGQGTATTHCCRSGRAS
jgi:hypothetical protein